MAYFHPQQSIYHRYHGDPERTLQTIADRYIGDNPQHPPVYRVFRTDGFLRNDEFQYVFDFDRKFPAIAEGQYVYAWAKLWSEQDGEFRFGVNGYGPIDVYVNREHVHRTTIADEMFPERKQVFVAKLIAGWNHFVVRFTKTELGCGGRFGTGSFKNMPFHFLAPTANREGQEGWVYTAPIDEPLPHIPGEGWEEADSDVVWLPRLGWTEAELRLGRFGRQFAGAAGVRAVAWTKAISERPGKHTVAFTGSFEGKTAVYVGGQQAFAGQGDNLRFEAALSFGETDVVVVSEREDGGRWDFALETNEPGIRFRLPHPVHGTDDVWLYAGPFGAEVELSPEQLCRMDGVFPNGQEGVYWRVDAPHAVVRPYLENKLFAKWNYPLGVTLYGMLETGLALKREQYVDYVLEHVETCTAFDDYALWDKERYGAAAINTQLSAIDSLDDCGSFAALMMRAIKVREPRGANKTAARIADYISNVQDRLPDGALYRVRGSTEFMKDTLWCDDLYMSTPFLCEYYKATGERKYIDDAASQFLLYKKYLYMPELQIMSHVYDFKFDKPTRIPWGRGNGWVLFSLTELLAALPEDHEKRAELLCFFRELSEGYLRLQGERGLWHQVLTVPESYEETSCTSMFAYAFARGVRFGWYEQPEPYIRSVMRAWEGLTRVSVDQYGNVYGVCRGSGYSFSTLYYKDELSWNLNDTHGIGIVMLAGVETIKLQRHLRQ